MGIESISFPQEPESAPRAFINEVRIEVYAEPDVHLKNTTKAAFLNKLSELWDKWEREFSRDEDAHGPHMLKTSFEVEPR